ncbi:MAG: BON domain-containing protein [Edaphocola sp.]
MDFKKMIKSSAFVAALSVTLWSCGPKDADIKASVDQKLANTPGVTAVVEKGVVTLSGVFADEAAKAKAEADIKTVKGVKSVTDNATVTPPVVINPDEALISSIQTGLSAKGFSGIAVTVANGEVTLAGNAKRADLQTIMQIANESKPKKVLNKLVLK